MGSQGSGDGQFNSPNDIAVDSSDNVYVVDSGNHRIQKFDSNGNFITKWGSEGTGDGQFYNGLSGIGVDSSDNVYVVEPGNNRIQKFDSNGNFITKWGSGGIDYGQFKYPYDVAVDSLGNAYVTDTENQRIQKFSIEKFTPTITWSTPADIIYETALGSTQLSASASVPGTFTYTPPAGTVLGAGTHSLHVDFTPTDSANYNTASKDVTINVLKATPAITWNNLADIIAGIELSDTQLSASASVPGTFVYNKQLGTILDVGTHTLHVDFTPTDIANYTTASKDVTINVLEKPAIPSASFWATPITGKVPLQVQFTDKSIGVPTSRFWNFGDKSTSTDKNPVHQYIKAGKYTVSLTVKNELGSNTRKISNYIVVKK
ncbi:PKD domain-containing protein [Methanosarcina sp.]|uniref:PKD domain-containing protein n=1 Tax=Methanosarcina sp. TaxID=2213 RepID=UPI003C72D1EC